MSYDIKIRRHVLQIRASEGLSFSKVALRFGVAKQTVYNWSKRLEEKKKRYKPPIKIDMDVLKKDIELYPDSYQYERAERLGVTPMGIWHALKRLGVTYKKNPKASQSGCRKTLCLLRKS
jgi:transposase